MIPRLLAALLLLPAALPAVDYVWPADSGVIDVRRDHGAKGDGVSDDTAAIQAAITAAHRRNRYSPPLISLPFGIYRITAPLETRDPERRKGDGWCAGMILVGESRERTVLRLDDQAPGYGDGKAPRPMILTGSESDQANPGGGGNRAFLHSVINLTLDTGRGNPGAVGIDWAVSNRGSIEEVTVRSGDGAGFCGIRMERPWPGPALLTRVAVQGFDHALRLAHYQYGITGEDLVFSGQRVAVVRNTDNGLWLRGVTSDNRVPFYTADGKAGRGLLVLLDSDLKGGEAGTPAITGEGGVLLERVRCSGYGRASTLGGTAIPAGERISGSHPALRRLGSGATAARLPVREVPVWADRDLSRWANATAFGATPQQGGDDDAPGIQAAIDSGAATVYLQHGSYRLRSPVVLRGNLRRLVGCHASLAGPDDQPTDPLLRFSATGTVVVEHLRIDFRRKGCAIEHDGSGDLVLRHCDLPGYRNTPRGTGALFLQDVRGGPLHFEHPQQVWARQLDLEFGDEPLLVNRAADFWLLGYKTEGEPITLLATGGRSEIWGAMIYPLEAKRLSPERPCFAIEGGSALLAWRSNGSVPYPVQLRAGAEKLTPAGLTKMMAMVEVASPP